MLDNRFTCWELAAEFDEAMGKPLCSKYDCPILPDIQQALENEENVPSLESNVVKTPSQGKTAQLDSEIIDM